MVLAIFFSSHLMAKSVQVPGTRSELMASLVKNYYGHERPELSEFEFLRNLLMDQELGNHLATLRSTQKFDLFYLWISFIAGDSSARQLFEVPQDAPIELDLEHSAGLRKTASGDYFKNLIGYLYENVVDRMYEHQGKPHSNPTFLVVNKRDKDHWLLKLDGWGYHAGYEVLEGGEKFRIVFGPKTGGLRVPLRDLPSVSETPFPRPPGRSCFQWLLSLLS